MKSGQILILILLIVVVALAVGLSVASRNITNLRTSTQTEQSQRAFSAAEGGVEDVLSRLQNISDQIKTGSFIPSSGCVSGGINTAACTIDVGNEIKAKVDVVSNKQYEFTLKPGEVGQVNLDTYAGDIKIEWIKVSDPVENPSGGGDTKASIELAYVCAAASCLGDSAAPGQTYSQHREAYESTAIAGQTGFVPQVSALPSVSYACAPVEFLCNVQRNVSGVKILRIKPFWRQATIKVSGVGASASTFPVQTFEIESVATSEIGVTRRIKVTRTALEQLPAAFDYVLFSEGDIVK